MSKTPATHKLRLNDPLKEATLSALKRMADPLIDLMIDAGVTVHDYGQLVRERAVRVAVKRIMKETGRASKSRVAIITGLPRSEVARILRSGDILLDKRVGVGQHPARRVLSAWFNSPRFLATSGDPAVLPIFGKRRSFEQLVAKYSRGIPVRAMLDELTQIGAVELLSDQHVRAKSRNPILTGLTGGAITAIGERTRDLLDTLMTNLRRTSNPLFVGTAYADEIDDEFVSLMRREITDQGVAFLESANSLFGRSNIQPKRSRGKSKAKSRLGITVYYFQDDAAAVRESNNGWTIKRRKNLQRQRRATSKTQATVSVSPLRR